MNDHDAQMFLAADIGGTKARLGLFGARGTAPLMTRTYRTAAFAHPADLLASFLSPPNAHPRSAVLGVAGPVHRGRVRGGTLPWTVDAAELERLLGLDDVRLVNDVEASAHGLAALQEHDLAVVHQGAPGATGTRAMVSAGTGLGEAALWWDGSRHHAAASEGGSCSFAPCTPAQVDLYRFLAAERERVSVGTLCSGPGLGHIYRFLTGEWQAPEPAAIAAEAEADRSSAASAAVDLLLEIYGARAGDVALSYGASGGVYLGGGLAPKLRSRLLEGGFLRAFLAKGGLRHVLERIPVRVVINEDVALLGAALLALSSASSTRQLPMAA